MYLFVTMGASLVKRFICIIIILVECLGIFAIARHLALVKSMKTAVNNEIPEGVQLTSCREITNEWPDNSIVVPAGTKVIPVLVSSDLINFEYQDPDSDSNKLIMAVPEDFVEQDLIAQILDEYRINAEQVHKPIIQRGIIKGTVFGTCWLAIGGVLTAVLLHKQKTRVLLIGHILMTASIYVIAIFIII